MLYRTHLTPSMARLADQIAMEHQARRIHAAMLATKRGTVPSYTLADEVEAASDLAKRFEEAHHAQA